VAALHPDSLFSGGGLARAGGFVSYNPTLPGSLSQLPGRHWGVGTCYDASILVNTIHDKDVFISTFNKHQVDLYKELCVNCTCCDVSH